MFQFYIKADHHSKQSTSLVGLMEFHCRIKEGNKKVGRRTKLNNVRHIFKVVLEDHDQKSRIQEIPTLSTNVDSRTDTILERLRDLSLFKRKKEKKKINCWHKAHPKPGSMVYVV